MPTAPIFLNGTDNDPTHDVQYDAQLPLSFLQGLGNQLTALIQGKSSRLFAPVLLSNDGTSYDEALTLNLGLGQLMELNQQYQFFHNGLPPRSVEFFLDTLHDRRQSLTIPQASLTTVFMALDQYYSGTLSAPISITVVRHYLDSLNFRGSGYDDGTPVGIGNDM